MSNWSNMSRDIGSLILDKLPEVAEHIRFAAVCKQWYAHAKDYNVKERPKNKALPMLLVPPNTITGTKPNLYALSCRGSFYQNLELPLAYAYRYCGSSHGWLATQNPDFSITLEYPFNDKVPNIHLPVLDRTPVKLPEYQVHKLIVSPDATPNDYTVVVLYGGLREIATIKSGEDSWVFVDCTNDVIKYGSRYHDLIFHKGLVYVLDKRHKIVTVDVRARPPKVNILVPRPKDYEDYDQSYLVETTYSDLLLVQRHLDLGEEDEDAHELVVEDNEGDIAGEHELPVEDDEGDIGGDDMDNEYNPNLTGYYADPTMQRHLNFHLEDKGRRELAVLEEEGDTAGDSVENEYMLDTTGFYPTPTFSFTVYKLHINDVTEATLEKVVRRDLSGDALFLGDGMSVAVSAKDIPGCQPDSIYYTDDYWDGGFYQPNGPEDVGCYNYPNDSVAKHYIPKKMHKDMPPAIWVFPPYNNLHLNL